MLETIERLAWALKVSEAEVLAVYPELVELNRQIDIPFDHYKRLRSLPLDERPPTLKALRAHYEFRRVFWGEVEEDPKPRRKPRRR